VAVSQWDVFEVALRGPVAGNPFVDVQLTAQFKQNEQTVEVAGFYDGDGAFRIRFMPTTQGRWQYRTRSNAPELDNQSGEFVCVPPDSKNHGPVHVANTFHFAYADGTPYRPIGTTVYAMTHQSEALEQETIESLRGSPFNKLRFCVFPKRYSYVELEPPRYPFEGTAPNHWDFTLFNPKFFQHLEMRIAQLRDMGIEADLILFHPYDVGHWGFDRMDAASDDRYVRYVIARLAAYRNIWWSLANENDFMKEKKESDWDRLFKVVEESDPYAHLRSIHNGKLIYNHTHPWVTHASIQNGSAVEDFGRATLYRDVYRKPIVFDEVKYEGNLPQRWGNISAEEMVHRCWQGTIAGTYAGHGETYLHPEHIIWWARGGTLHGKSPARLKFLEKILKTSPATGIEPIDKWQDVHTAGEPGEYYLVYFGHEKPAEWTFELPRVGLSAGMNFTVEILDTWEMTITPVEGKFEIIADAFYRFRSKGLRAVKLQGKPFIALRILRADDAAARREQALRAASAAGD
jgi:hypothetical protein